MKQYINAIIVIVFSLKQATNVYNLLIIQKPSKIYLRNSAH